MSEIESEQKNQREFFHEIRTELGAFGSPAFFWRLLNKNEGDNAAILREFENLRKDIRRLYDEIKSLKSSEKSTS